MPGSRDARRPRIPDSLLYVMVADIGSTLDAVVRSGGRIVRPMAPDARERVALFADPDGNVLGLYQEG